MPVLTSIISSKFYNQLSNGTNFSSNTSDYTYNLVGCVGERIKVIQRVGVRWYTASSDSNYFSVSGTGTLITRQEGKSFITDDGFSIGDTISYDSSGNPSIPDGTGTITLLTHTQMGIAYDVGCPPIPDGIYDYTTHHYLRIEGTTSLTSLVYKFGLIENNDTLNYLNRVTQSEQCFYSANIATYPTATTLSILGGNKDWADKGTCTVSYVSTTNYVHIYEVSHSFIIPAYKKGEKTNLENNQIIDSLKGLLSYKYVFECEFRTVLSNPNTSKYLYYEINLGCVAWFNENFNGFNNNYVIDSIVYEDSLTAVSCDSLQTSAKTKATITLSKLAGSFVAGQNVGLLFQCLTKEEYYTNTTTDFEDNFLFENIICAEGATNTGSIIKSIDIDIITGKLKIVVEFEFTLLQQSKLENTDGYLISILVSDTSISAGNSDRVMLLAETNNFIISADIDNLFDITDWKISSIEMWNNIPQWTNLNNQFVEDNTYHEITFKLDRAIDSYLNSLEFALIAYNNSTNDYFILDKYTFDIIGNSTFDSVNDIQYININDNRSYNFKTDNEIFNLSKLYYDSSAGSYNYYKIKIGQKITWQDWIKQSDANAVFFDSTKLNNNLNKKASNYANLNGYQIKFALIINCSGIDNLGKTGFGNYLYMNSDNIIYEYNEATSLISGDIDILHPTTLINLGTSIGKNFNTHFKTTFTKSGGFVNADWYYVVHRIEVYRQNGFDIYEINSKNTNDQNTNNPLIPLSTETQLKKTLGAGTLISECLIDYTKLIDTNYKLSSRIIWDSEAITTVCILDEAGNCIQDENGNILIEE